MNILIFLNLSTIPSSPEGTASWSSAFLADSEDFAARPHNGPPTDPGDPVVSGGVLFLGDTKQSKRIIEVYSLRFKRPECLTV